MIPIVLVTGFLGSGKTTLLRRIADAHRERRLVFLVNEFSETDVDGQLLGRADRSVSVSGGSIFCRCKASDLIDHLQAIPERFGRDGPIDGVVIEASGIADPRVAGLLLHETGLDAVYRLASAVCIVDPGTFGKLLHTLENIRHQVQSADLVVLNKCDLFDDAALAEVEARVREISSGVGIRRTTFCNVDLDLGAEHAAVAAGGEMAPCRDPNYRSIVAPIRQNVDWPRLADGLAALGDSLYRVKGFVPADGRMNYVDGSAGRLTICPASPSVAAGLVLIVAGDAPAAAEELADEIRSGRFYTTAQP